MIWVVSFPFVRLLILKEELAPVAFVLGIAIGYTRTVAIQPLLSSVCGTVFVQVSILKGQPIQFVP
jgi:hypothetical protein